MSLLFCLKFVSICVRILHYYITGTTDKGHREISIQVLFPVMGKKQNPKPKQSKKRDTAKSPDIVRRQAVQKPSEAVLLANVHRCTRMSMEAVQRRIGGFLGYTIFQ